ncbi:MAG: hypothetical protein ACPIFQ_10290, partial [Candidatus Puniceispirillaceae bacterium]
LISPYATLRVNNLMTNPWISQLFFWRVISPVSSGILSCGKPVHDPNCRACITLLPWLERAWNDSQCHPTRDDQKPMMRNSWLWN